MAVTDEEEIPREICVGYRLLIQAAGPGFSDEIEVKVDIDSFDELTPEVVTKDGFFWERYGTTHDHVEVRQDYIWARSINPVMVPNPLFVEPSSEDVAPVLAQPEASPANTVEPRERRQP